jgi:uncharacterized protein
MDRPSIRRHHNRVMHLVGKSIRVFFNRVNQMTGNVKFDPSYFQINQMQVHLPRLSQEFVGYRLVHISDIHMGTWMNAERLAGVVDLVNQQQPDLICITGDFITHVIDGVKSILEAELSRLAARDGVLAVLGNHDYWSDAELLCETLQGARMTVLHNDVFTIRRGSACLHFAGLDDVYNRKDDLGGLLHKLPHTGAAIALVHVCDYAKELADTERFGLALSGHSHGGQIKLPLLGSPILPPLGRHYIRGQYQINGMLQYTTTGVGTSTIPYRWNCPPEIAVFELYRQNNSQ